MRPPMSWMKYGLHFRWNIKWRLELFGALRVMAKTPTGSRCVSPIHFSYKPTKLGLPVIAPSCNLSNAWWWARREENTTMFLFSAGIVIIKVSDELISVTFSLAFLQLTFWSLRLITAAVLGCLSTAAPNIPVSVARPTSHAAPTVITVVSIHSCVTIHRSAAYSDIRWFPVMFLDLFVSWRRRVWSLACHFR